MSGTTNYRPDSRQTTRVLHIVNGEHYAGAERVQDLLALRLPESGYDVSFACLKDGIFDEKRMSTHTPLRTFRMKSNLDIRIASQIARFIRSEGHQIIHTHTPRAALVGQVASLMTGLPMFHHVHSPSQSDTENRWRNVRNSLVEKLSLLRAVKLIPVSASLRQYLLRLGYKPDRLCVVPNGVPTQDKLRRRFTPTESLVVGMVALFRPRKGVEVLLDAIAEAVRAGADIRLHAVGPFETEDYERSVLDRVNRLNIEDRVRWTGFTSQVNAEFSKMHIFVLPSLFGEGMPMVVLEAMAAGVPVISTMVEGIPEVIRTDRDGLLVEAGSVESLKRALCRIAGADCNIEKMGDSARARQIEFFSDVAMANGVAQVYGALPSMPNTTPDVRGTVDGHR